MIKIDKQWMGQFKFTVTLFDDYGLPTKSLLIKPFVAQVLEKVPEKGGMDPLVALLKPDDFLKLIKVMGDNEEYEWCGYFSRMKERRNAKSDGYWELIAFDHRHMGERVGIDEEIMLKLLGIEE